VPARSERGEEEQEVVLGPGDARDLRDVDDSQLHARSWPVAAPAGRSLAPRPP